MKTFDAVVEEKTMTVNDLPTMKMWQEGEDLYLLVTTRSGLFTFDFPDGYTADFLVDLDKTPKDQKDFTIYKYRGMQKLEHRHTLESMKGGK